MKKSTLVFALSTVICFAVKAQITISQSNMPATGNVFAEATDNSGTITSPGGSGASQTWNFNTMNASAVDTITVISPSSTPSIYSSQCPGTPNVAFKYSNTGSNEALYEYYNSSASSFNLDGIVFNSSAYGNVMYRYTKAWALYSLPATYKSHWKGSYRGIMKTYDASGGGIIDSVEAIETGTYTDSIDSWGNMTTPAGIFSSLRDKHLETDIDSTYYYEAGSGWVFGGAYTSKNNLYEWLTNQNNFNYILVDMLVDSAGAVTQLQWLDNKVVGIDEVYNDSKTISFPNPANNIFHIETNAVENGQVKIYDVSGRAIEANNFSNSKAVINTSQYKNGMYFYILTDTEGNVIDRNKFSIVK